ncbi:MAG: 23S rRNA (adenine(2503)-C(2))-methyltransferase RlmN [Lachnospiraceae bacterium]|nr:23S rRNA (adenine(2503)-C(2))-methyltransferase RlmN [Lachnospiraceae bacterium]
MTDLRSLTPEELRAALQDMGQPSFRADQIFDWLHRKKVRTLDEMTNLPKALREKLKEDFTLSTLTLHTRQISRDGTRKYLFLLPDRQAVESVLMHYDYGSTVCVSSQVGCRMGCHFCASTIGGLSRDLLPGEMLEQIYRIEEDAGLTVNHLVVMGTGEPLDNLDNLIRFLRLLTHPAGKNLSERNITVSTCGLVPQIARLAEEHLGITLALSLHAPSDELRRTMMPIANRYTIAETLAACDAYFAATGRRMSYEYSLVRGVNDQPEHAQALSALLKGKNCHVNLIPVNPVAERSYEASQEASVARFQKILEKNGINATIRKKMGADIDGACGQLRRRLME